MIDDEALGHLKHWLDHHVYTGERDGTNGTTQKILKLINLADMPHKDPDQQREYQRAYRAAKMRAYRKGNEEYRAKNCERMRIRRAKIKAEKASFLVP